jgi:hypothetical protein
MKILIVIYEHRHGVDAWPVSIGTTEEEVIKGLEEWEPERGETIELRGPFERDAYSDVWSS